MMSIDYSKKKLFGRKDEVKILKSLFQKCDKGPVAVFVSGPTGSGKSTLINTALQSSSAFFLSAKFEDSCGSCCVLLEAFASLQHQVRSSSSFTTNEKSTLQKIVQSVQYASSAFNTLDKQEQSSPVRGRGFQLLKRLLRTYLKKVCCIRKTVLVVDNLHFCHASSCIDLFSSFINDSEMTNFMLVGALTQEEESSSLGGGSRWIDEFAKLEYASLISLTNLGKETSNELVSHLLKMDPESTKELAAVVHERTGGNPFFMLEFMKMLESSNLMFYSAPNLSWQFDLNRIVRETTMTSNLVDCVESRLQQLTHAEQRLLKIAACLGGRFDAATLGALLGVTLSVIREIIMRCSNQGVIMSVAVKSQDSTSAQEFYKFSHERIQQASYAMINAARRERLHLRLGRLLRRAMVDVRNDKYLLLCTDQLNRGRCVVSDAKEKVELARQNLDAARMSKKNSAFFPASDFVDVSLELLAHEGWTDHYDLYLESLTMGADLDLCCGKTERCRARAMEVLEKAATENDKVDAYFTLVKVHTISCSYEQALTVGYGFLKQLGVDVEKHGYAINVGYEFLALWNAIKTRQDMELLSLPVAEEENTMRAIKMMITLLSSAHWSNREYEYGYMVVTMMRLTLKEGLTEMVGAVFSCFAGTCAFLGKFELANRMATIGRQLDHRVGSKAYQCTSMLHRLLFVEATKNCYLSLDPFLRAYRVGMEIGDSDNSSSCLLGYVMAYFQAGLPLSFLVQDCKMFSLRMQEYGQRQQLSILKLYHQTALNLMGKANETATVLEGEVIDEIETFFSGDDATEDNRRLQSFSFLVIMLAFYYRDHKRAFAAAEYNESFLDSNWPCFFALPVPFFRALVWIEAARNAIQRHRYLRKARQCMDKMEKGMKQGMINLQHMLYIVKAEYMSIRCKPWIVGNVKRAFDRAARHSKRSGFAQNAALANELAARFMLDMGDKDWAVHYMKRSAELYGDWGAHGKTDHLTKEFEVLSKSARKLVGQRRVSHGLRGRPRFEEIDQEEILKGYGLDVLWSAESSDGLSSSFI